MSAQLSILQALAKLEADNGAGALCTVVRSQGSTPRHTTSKMLVYPDGSIVGTVGGGEMENRASCGRRSRQSRMASRVTWSIK